MGLLTRFVDVETGLDIPGVASFSVSCDGPEHFVLADLKLAFVEIEADVRARVLAEYRDLEGHKELREVAKIIWADGSSTDFD